VLAATTVVPEAGQPPGRLIGPRAPVRCGWPDAAGAGGRAGRASVAVLVFGFTGLVRRLAGRIRAAAVLAGLWRVLPGQLFVNFG
jgi:hypothetical protein